MLTIFTHDRLLRVLHWAHDRLERHTEKLDNQAEAAMVAFHTAIDAHAKADTTLTGLKDALGR